MVAEEAGALLGRVETDVRGLSRNWLALRSGRVRPREPQSNEDELEERPPDPPFFLESSSSAGTVRMLTTGPSLLAEAGTGQLRLVEYRIEYRSGTNTLIRSERPAFGGHRAAEEEVEVEGEEVEIGHNVDRFAVRCFDGKDWLDSWDEESPACMPAAVEIRIEVSEVDPGDRREAESAKVGSIVAVCAWSNECLPKDEDADEAERGRPGARR